MAKKRANGEGSIRKRKDGRWEGRYTAGRDPETGKPIYKNVLGKTQAEVKEKLKAAMEENKKIDVSKAGQYTVADWCWLWHGVYCKPAVKDTTAAYYQSYIQYHVVPCIGSIKLDKLTTLDLQKFYNQTRKSGRVEKYAGMPDKSLSVRTVRGIHAMLRQCLDQAVLERLIPYNPAAACRLPPKEKREMHILPPEKIKDYLAAAEEHGVLAMFYLELTTGLRRGELVALQWSDLDVERQILTISKSAGRFKGEVRISPPKTANSVRKVFLPKETVKLLIKEHRKHPFNPVMFPSPVTGQMYGPDCVGRLHKTLCKKAGITENIRFHDLRHTYATLAIQNGVDAKTVSSILGHYSAGFTLDTYTHTTPAMQQAAADKVGSFIAQAV